MSEYCSRPTSLYQNSFSAVSAYRFIVCNVFIQHIHSKLNQSVKYKMRVKWPELSMLWYPTNSHPVQAKQQKHKKLNGYAWADLLSREARDFGHKRWNPSNTHPVQKTAYSRKRRVWHVNSDHNRGRRKGPSLYPLFFADIHATAQMERQTEMKEMLALSYSM